MAKDQAIIKKGEKKMKKISLTMTVLVLTFVIAIALNCFAGEGPKVLKVKGLYIGMDLSEAKKATSQLTDGKRQLVLKSGHCCHCDDKRTEKNLFRLFPQLPAGSFNLEGQFYVRFVMRLFCFRSNWRIS